MLAAGIDVFSTVNVQHLESLNDQVAELTGIRVRETVPDAVVGAADEVVLIDITPQSLIERLMAGKVYPTERVQAALNNFFKVENLAALREVALRQVAEEVEAKRIPVDGGGRPGDDRLIDTAAPDRRRRAAARAGQARSRGRSGWSAGPGARPSASAPSSTSCGWPTTSRTPRSRSSSTRCAGSSSVLGAHLLVEHGDDVAHGRPARGPRPRNHLRVDRDARSLAGRCGGSPSRRSPTACWRCCPGVDLRIVADRTQRVKGDST